ncbi:MULTISPECIES: DUF4190 domain-containing protein [Actinoplanes]|uniref:DUF4190 domain-containing protein n=1 Tax=Actinoplanes TaxID=1865 RepID=UPI00069606DA|nr:MULTISPECIES: DUF4190 domain-containing protein [Actinoplanes]GLY01291.1 hypothetical protein Acsp01_16700 [Actinoplanes sp. NBRC 101535]
MSEPTSSPFDPTQPTAPFPASSPFPESDSAPPTTPLSSAWASVNDPAPTSPFPPQPYSPAPDPYKAPPQAYAPPPQPYYAPQQQAGYPPQSPYPPQPMYQPVVIGHIGPPTSGLAVASMVLGIISALTFFCTFGVVSLLAIIFGHIGLNETKDNRKSGKGMAITGLVLGYIALAPAIAILLTSGISGLTAIFAGS